MLFIHLVDVCQEKHKFFTYWSINMSYLPLANNGNKFKLGVVTLVVLHTMHYLKFACSFRRFLMVFTIVILIHIYSCNCYSRY